MSSREQSQITSLVSTFYDSFYGAIGNLHSCLQLCFLTQTKGLTLNNVKERSNTGWELRMGQVPYQAFSCITPHLTLHKVGIIVPIPHTRKQSLRKIPVTQLVGTGARNQVHIYILVHLFYNITLHGVTRFGTIIWHGCNKRSHHIQKAL